MIAQPSRSRRSKLDTGLELCDIVAAHLGLSAMLGNYDRNNQSWSIYDLLGTYPAKTVFIAPRTVNVTGCASLYADSAVNVAARRI